MDFSVPIPFECRWASRDFGSNLGVLTKFNDSDFPFAELEFVFYFPSVSTLVEIQEAVAKLRDDEKRALSLWLSSQTDLEMSAQDERRLVCSLDEAMRDVDSGKGASIQDVRSRVRSWASK